MRISDICVDYSWQCLYIDDVTWMLRLIIPLSLTIFLFVYKESKDIGVSDLNFVPSYPILYKIYFIVSGMLFCWTVLLRYSIIHIEIALVNKISLVLIVVWLFLLGASCYILLKSIDIRSSTKKNIEKFELDTEEIIRDLELVSRNSILESRDKRKIDKKLRKITKSVVKEYQLLIYKVKNNHLDDYERAFKDYNDLVTSFIGEMNASYIYMILNNSNDEFFNFYKTVLRHNVLLLRNLENNETLSNTRNIIENFESFSIKSQKGNSNLSVFSNDNINKYVKEYYKSFYEIINTLSGKSHNYIRSILYILKTNEGASGIDKLYKEKDLLMFLAALLYRSIDQNDVKSLTEVTNIILELSKNQEVSTIKTTTLANVSVAFPEEIYEDHDFYEDIHSTTGSSDSDDEMFNEAPALVLLLGLIKSLEFGKYECAGFINKVLVKYTNSTYIKDSLDKVNNLIENDDISEINTLNFNNKFLNSELVSELDINFNFSEISIEYCFQKAVFLISTQQKYLGSNGLNIYSVLPNIAISDYIHNQNQIEYIEKKLITKAKDFGMLAIQKKTIVFRK